MKKLISVCLLSMILIGCSDTSSTEQAPDKTTENKVEDTAKDTEKAVEKAKDTEKLTDEQKAKIVEYFKSDKEPSIVDALFPYDTLKLGVHNDGSNRDGLADYACQILVNDFNVKELVVVKIIDIDKLVKTDKWETIGEKNCNYN